MPLTLHLRQHDVLELEGHCELEVTSLTPGRAIVSRYDVDDRRHLHFVSSHTLEHGDQLHVDELAKVTVWDPTHRRVKVVIAAPRHIDIIRHDARKRRRARGGA